MIVRSRVRVPDWTVGVHNISPLPTLIHWCQYNVTTVSYLKILHGKLGDYKLQTFQPWQPLDSGPLPFLFFHFRSRIHVFVICPFSFALKKRSQRRVLQLRNRDLGRDESEDEFIEENLEKE